MRTAPDNRFELHDRLCGLHEVIRTAWRDGESFRDEDVENLLLVLTACIDEAAELYRQLSAKRWNERAAADPLAEAVIAEATRPGGNLLLFPVAGRPLPGDALQLIPTHDRGNDCP